MVGEKDTVSERPLQLQMDPQTIVVLRALQLGDLLCAVPAFRSLRTAFPKAHIALIGLPWAETFVGRFARYLDEFIEFPGYPGLPEQPVAVSAVPAFLLAMQRRRFDLALQMHGNGRHTNQLLALLDARTAAGFVAEALSSKLNAEGLRTVAVPLDVADAEAPQSALHRFSEQYGRLDILINAAIDKTVSVEELTVPEWDRILATNLRGPFVMSKSALQIMIKRGTGHIINIVSTAAKRAWANASAYHASKWGLLGLSHALHVEARSHGVKVTAASAVGCALRFYWIDSRTSTSRRCRTRGTWRRPFATFYGCPPTRWSRKLPSLR